MYARSDFGACCPCFYSPCNSSRRSGLEPWRDEGTVLAALLLTLYFYILVAHRIAFLTCGEETAKAPVAVPDRSVTVE
jgi:hypothetical protein